MICVLHGSKFPPSPSGISLYALAFETALAPDARVSRLAFHPEPRVTQQLRTSLKAFFKGLSGGVGDVDVFHVELGGRSLAEFYFVVGLLLRRTRPWVVATCHDVPSLVGSSMLFSALDRRGMRRLGLWASRSAGHALETRVLDGIDTVLTLTRSGERAMREQWGRPAHFLGHVIYDEGVAVKSPVVYLPGYVGRGCRIADICRIVHQAPPARQGRWRVIVGAADPEHVEEELAALSQEERSSVVIQGAVEEAEILATFREAAVVLRTGSGQSRSNYYAASGPLAIAIRCGCRVLTDDPRPVVQELHDEGLIEGVAHPLDALRDLLDAAAGTALRAKRPVEAVDLYGREATRRRYWSALRADAAAAIQSVGSP